MAKDDEFLRVAAAEAARPSGWYPMESAPRDGTPVMLYARHHQATAAIRVEGWWHSGAEMWVASGFSSVAVPLVAFLWTPLPNWPASDDRSGRYV